MKMLTIVVDEIPIFSGEVAEINWSETVEQVSVTGRFKPAPSLLESLKGLQPKAQRQNLPAPIPDPDGLEELLGQ